MKWKKNKTMVINARETYERFFSAGSIFNASYVPRKLQRDKFRRGEEKNLPGISEELPAP